MLDVIEPTARPGWRSYIAPTRLNEKLNFAGGGVHDEPSALNVETVQFEPAPYDSVDTETRSLLENVFDYYSRFHPFRLSTREGAHTNGLANIP